VSRIYELPIGPGKALNVTGLKGKLIGVWSVTGIQSLAFSAIARVTRSRSPRAGCGRICCSTARFGLT
jgi:hypothetical protein